MAKRKFPALSFHPTLNGRLEVDWNKEYQNDFFCPHCKVAKLNNAYKKYNYSCKLKLYCRSCKKSVSLTCQLPAYIFNYRPNLECPNPLCTQLGHDGQKGWIFKTKRSQNQYQCRFCGVGFNPKSTHCNSWAAQQKESSLLAFSFDEDIWDLRHFYKKPHPNSINFSQVFPQWYRLEVKKYLQYLLKIRAYSATSGIRQALAALKQLGEIIQQQKIKKYVDINRKIIHSFLDQQNGKNSTTINAKLSYLKSFFEYLEIDASSLIRSRDYLKERRHDPDWLDEVTRINIYQNLNKIPAPLARQYLLQEYIAVRPSDIRNLSFDCLIEEKGNWYVQFFQGKPSRWHRIPANREIRKVIEEQQKWIRENLGSDYLYLFCHFRGVDIRSYPNFPSFKPLPSQVPNEGNMNQMVRMIQILIEKEDVRDANGQKPHFMGKITRPSKLQEIRVKHGIKAAQLYANHTRSETTLRHYAPPTTEQIAKVDLPFQKLLLNPDNKFLPWQSLPESLLKNPKAHELDLEIAPRLVVYGHCALDPKIPCPVNLFPKCYGCSSFRPSTSKLPLYERQYQGEKQRLKEAKTAGAELAKEEAKSTIEAMDKWLPELKRLANG